MARERLTQKIAAQAKDNKKPADKGRDTDGFDYDKSKAKVLKKVLHNINVSLGTLIGAMKELSMLRGSEITPDGKLGGRGFIMNFRDMKMMINEAIGNLSDITDTIGDELTNPKWDLKETEIKNIIKEKEKVQDKAEKVEEDAKEVEEKEEISEPADIEEKEADNKEISPDDVKDSNEIESLKRYKELLDNPKDKVAKILGKNILANLLR